MKRSLLTGAVLLFAFSASAQLSQNDYARAEKFLSYNIDPLVDGGNVRANWLPGDKFWFLSTNSSGHKFYIVDPKKGKSEAFDHVKLAQTLASVTNKTYDPNKLPFQAISVANDGASISFMLDNKKWKYEHKLGRISEDKSPGTIGGGMAMPMGRGAGRAGGIENVSPDGKKAVYIKDWNLWVKDIASGKETQLTTDGIKDFGWATDNAAWKSSDRAILKWSPDSKKISTFKQDQRHLSDMHLVTTNVGNPTLRSWKYALPTDKDVARIYRAVIDIETGKTTMLKVDADVRRGSLSDDIASSGTFDDNDWRADGSELAFLSISRDHKINKLRIANTQTGEVREVFEEIVPTYYESGRGAINWRYLPASSEILWYSERDNWGHLYLYDSNTGKLKNQITKGEFVVTRVLQVDEKNRQIFFMTTGLDPENPYFQKLARVNFDGKGFTVLTPESGNHAVTFSPSFAHFIDVYSKPDVPAVTVLKNMTGKTVAELDKADVSRLLASGWKPPVPVKLLAADQKTDIYGLVFLPTNMVAGKKYPVVNYIYPGPQGGSVGNWSFSAARSDHQALAELGFIVVLIEGTSNPFRSKSYHDMNYGNMAENTLPDQIAGIKQLAQKYPIDIDKVGIWGHSGGGFATASAMFKHGDFYKVGIAESGNHDNRNYADTWGDRYNGLAGSIDYDAQANHTHAKNLKGKLLLAHGMMDNNVPPSHTMLIVDELIKNNKDFDLLLFPNSAHSFGQFAPYMMRRRWDYFVQHLQNQTPPQEFPLRGTAPTTGAQRR